MPEGNGRWIEYAGGYSDMLAQRGADLTRESSKQQEPQKRLKRPLQSLPKRSRRSGG